MVVVDVAEDAESVGVCPERLAQVKALCRGYVDRGEKAFTQVLIARAGKIVLEDSYGMANLRIFAPLQMGPTELRRMYARSLSPCMPSVTRGIRALCPLSR